MYRPERTARDCRSRSVATAIPPRSRTGPSRSKASMPNLSRSCPSSQAFRRMVRDLEFDVCEMAPTTYLIARARGAPYIALPIFVMRRFHHGGFVVRPDAGIAVPKHLEGKRVGVRAYSVTTGVWTRGIFVNEYGLDSSKVTWVVDDEEHVTTLQAAAERHPRAGGQIAGEHDGERRIAGRFHRAGRHRTRRPADRQLGARRPDAGAELSGTDPECRGGRGRLVPPHRHLSDPRHHRREDRGAGRKPLGSRGRCSTPSPRPRRPISNDSSAARARRPKMCAIAASRR